MRMLVEILVIGVLVVAVIQVALGVSDAVRQNERQALADRDMYRRAYEDLARSNFVLAARLRICEGKQ